MKGNNKNLGLYGISGSPMILQGQLGVIWSTCLKTKKAKQSEILDSGTPVTYIWGTFDLLVVKVIWG